MKRFMQKMRKSISFFSKKKNIELTTAFFSMLKAFAELMVIVLTFIMLLFK